MTEELDEQIERSRRLIRSYEVEGKTHEAMLEENRLAGLLTARRLITGGGDDACQHPIHKAAGIDEQGRTLWRCTNPECGEIHVGP